MKTLKKIGYFILIIVLVFSIWLAISFIDIATKNHISDENYGGYYDWNLIIILNDYCIEKG